MGAGSGGYPLERVSSSTIVCAFSSHQIKCLTRISDLKLRYAHRRLFLRSMRESFIRAGASGIGGVPTARFCHLTNITRSRVTTFSDSIPALPIPQSLQPQSGKRPPIIIVGNASQCLSVDVRCAIPSLYVAYECIHREKQKSRAPSSYPIHVL
jgi:hypothetical protein